MLALALAISIGCLTEIDPVIAPPKDPTKADPQKSTPDGVPQKVDSPEGAPKRVDAPVGMPQDDIDPSKPPPTHPAVSVANDFLAAVASGEESAVLRYLPSSQKGLSVKDLQEKSFGVKEITDLRLAPESVGERAVQARLKVDGAVVHTLGLSLERGQYRFNSFLTPSAAEYGAAKQLWSK